MSEIQSIANPEWIKYLMGAVGGLVCIVNALMGYIFSLVKKDIGEIKIRQDADHDRLNEIVTEHSIFHPKKK